MSWYSILDEPRLKVFPSGLFLPWGLDDLTKVGLVAPQEFRLGSHVDLVGLESLTAGSLN